MEKSTPYKVCPKCGSHLDPGETCDCEDKRPLEADQGAAQSAAQLATPEQHEPVLAPGA